MAHDVLDEYLAGLVQALGDIDLDVIHSIADTINAARVRGSTVFFAGNGGSAATANHFACDISKNIAREGLARTRAVSLSVSPEALTAYGNDVDFSSVFSEQLSTYARTGDLLVAISASGTSPNIVAAVETARAMGLTVVTLSGFDGGAIAGLADLNLTVPLNTYEQIEDAHGVILHMLVSLLKTMIATAAV